MSNKIRIKLNNIADMQTALDIGQYLRDNFNTGPYETQEYEDNLTDNFLYYVEFEISLEQLNNFFSDERLDIDTNLELGFTNNRQIILNLNRC